MVNYIKGLGNEGSTPKGEKEKTMQTITEWKREARKKAQPKKWPCSECGAYYWYQVDNLEMCCCTCGLLTGVK